MNKRLCAVVGIVKNIDCERRMHGECVILSTINMLQFLTLSLQSAGLCKLQRIGFLLGNSRYCVPRQCNVFLILLQ
jgi:hypothetical protein